MDIKYIISYIPQFFNLFIPGFIFLIVYKYFVETSKEDFNVMAVGSVVLSYIFKIITDLICSYISVSKIINMLIPIVLAILCSLFVVKFRLTAFYKKIIKFIGKTTGSSNIWYDFFDVSRGSHVRFFTIYNDRKVMVKGKVKNFEAYDDGECNIVVSKYTIEYVDDGSIYKNDIAEAFMIFNTKNIYGIETYYG